MKSEKFSLICEVIFIFVAITTIAYKIVNANFENSHNDVAAIFLMEDAWLLSPLIGTIGAYALVKNVKKFHWSKSILAMAIWLGGDNIIVSLRQAQLDAYAETMKGAWGTMQTAEGAWYNKSEYPLVVANCYHDTWEVVLISIGCFLVAIALCYVLPWYVAKRKQA